MSLLAASGVEKAFGPVGVLFGAELEVAEGEIVALLGPSGCGKTTLLRVVAGFERLAAGRVVVGGVPVADGRAVHVPPQRRRIGYVPQEGALFPHLDVAANVAFGLPRGERRAAGGRARVDELLDLVGIGRDLRTRRPDQISGGQQQRVALARALAPRPALVLLDEPFASLDAVLRVSTGRAVVAALRAAGAGAVLVTHDQTEALSLADRVAVMREGRIVQSGAPGDVYAAPADAEVATFVGGAAVLPARVIDGRVECALGSLAPGNGVAATGRLRVAVRPEQITLGPPSTTGVRAKVRDVAFYGHDADVVLLLTEWQEEVVARVQGADLPTPGDDVSVRVRGAVRVLGAADGRD